MKFRGILFVVLTLLLCACASKQDDSQSDSMVQLSVARSSILEHPELEFAASYGDVLALSNPEQALSDVDERLANAEAEQDDTTALLVFRSLALSQLGRKDEAFDDMTKAIQAKPEAELYALRAFVLWRGGKLRGAMRDTEYAMLKQKNIPLATMVQGLISFSEKDMSMACSSLDVACKQGQCYGLQFVQEQGQCK